MSERKFTALGTASQVPTSRRNQHSSFLKWDRQGFLFDPGEGTQRQMIKSGIAASDITKIFITHFHGDHCLGLSGVLQRISLDNVSHTVDIHFPSSGEDYFHSIKNVASYYDTASLAVHPIDRDGIIYEDPHLTIHARRLNHPMETYGYRIVEKDSFTFQPEKLNRLGLAGPEIGRLQKEGRIFHKGRWLPREDVAEVRKGQVFAFIMDTAWCDAAVQLALSADLMVAESTFLDQDARLAALYGHLTAAQAAEIARSAEARTLLLTHFSQRYGHGCDFASEAKAVHGRVIQLEDGMSFQLHRKRIMMNS